MNNRHKYVSVQSFIMFGRDGVIILFFFDFLSKISKSSVDLHLKPKLVNHVIELDV